MPTLHDDLPGIRCLVAKAPNLSSFTMRSHGVVKASIFSTSTYPRDYTHLLQFYNAVAEHQTYPISIGGLLIPPPPSELNCSMTAHQHMEHFLKAGNLARFLILFGNEFDESTADALAKATDHGPGISQLSLGRTERLGDSFIKNIANIVARPGLQELDINLKDDQPRVQILESIQWEHLRELTIWLKRGSLERSVMKVLVDGVKATSGRVGLKEFKLCSENDASTATPLSLPQDLLQTFIASTSLEDLSLQVIMNQEQMLSLFKSADFSHLRSLQLWAKGFDSAQVEDLLDGLQHATNLKSLGLLHARITDELRERAKEMTIDSKYHYYTW